MPVHDRLIDHQLEIAHIVPAQREQFFCS